MLDKTAVVVAVDFGTSRTGYAYSYNADKEEKVYTRVDWEDSPVPYCKTLSQILYIDQKKAVEWGHSAAKLMKTAEGSKAAGSKSVPNYSLYKNFKMALYSHSGVEVTTNDYSHRQHDVVSIIGDYLTFIHKDVIDRITKASIYPLGGTEIKWCLTVPAIWDDAAKQAMRRAAVKAGIITSEQAGEEHFMLILEPEAAAAHCMSRTACQGSPLNEADTFLVVDAGGGTVDLTMHKVEGGKLREMQSGSGGPCGSTKLDKAFWKVMADKFSEEAIEEFKEKHPLRYWEMCGKWESIKCEVKTLDQPVFISIPKSLDTVLQRRCSRRAEELIDSEATLTLSPDDMAAIFDPVLNEVAALIEAQLLKVKQVDYVFLVGGFAKCPVLQERVKLASSGKVKNKVVVPDDPGEAIVVGAALMGRKPSVIKTRRVRQTYGIGVNKPFVPKLHSISKRFWHHEQCTYRCKDIFSAFVHSGTELEEGAVIEHTVCPCYSYVTKPQIEIFAYHGGQVMYTDDPGVKKIGEVVIDCPVSVHERPIRVRMYFGKTELKVEACEVLTGQKVATTLKLE